ncbi:MAG: DivIVA domain-containing protein, partial [Firmicutes bacterium]|nr:DivIVA domain-containing protein [Bacillota bacterium]
MEITGKVLREVEFRDRLRGYDFEEVDEFLEQVAVAVDAMQAELTSHRESLKLADDRIAKAEALIAELESQPSSGEPKPIDDEGIRKTLMLAQRTADMAIAEAKAEADKILSGARTDAEKVLSEADDYVKNMKTEAEKGLSSRIESMTAQHDQLVAEIKVLNQVLKAERARLTEALNSALRFVAQAFPVNESVANIAENGHTGLSSLLNSASNGSSEVSDNSVSNS